MCAMNCSTELLFRFCRIEERRDDLTHEDVTLAQHSLRGIAATAVSLCIVIAAGCTWAALAFVLFVWWSSRATWTRAHGFASAFGATLACMATPYLTIASWPKVDVIGKIIFDVLALVGFYALARKVFVKANPPALG